MRRLTLCLTLLIVSFSLAGCGGSGGDLPTRVPESDAPANIESPRDTLPAAPTPDTSLPPTWTPQGPPPPPPTSAPPTAPPPQPTLQTYTIQPGDTLAEIAARFNVDLADLSRVNNIVDADRIEVGDVLIIPSP